ncbi:hypothetical protein BCV70DRAFT_34486 [Testicularia cyperi]|uniref:Uncharacterized protein n=1 Tax=Testicularia cyperi TaxID=1882483 RepID=A0A317XJZ6_9BASI|nr:hypothetical protein BCV70DRAFT_34486 [Testicularia cyperi]
MSASSSPSKKAARALSPHRVSFSPSTEEIANAREQAQLAAYFISPSPASATAPSKTKSKDKKIEDKLPRAARSASFRTRWRGLKSHSTSDLPSTDRRCSVETTSSTVSSATPSEPPEPQSPVADRNVPANPDASAVVANAKRRFFRWDRRGIHAGNEGKGGDKGKVAKVKVTKHQATAARHAKTLEQVINAGMGLHPVPPRLSSTAHTRDLNDASAAKKGKKAKPIKARPIPVAEASQLKGLKSALLDADMANGIIDRLRSMPVPLDSLQHGIGRLEPDVKIGTAGDHGDERVLAASLPDSALDGIQAKDDSEIRKRPAAADLASIPIPSDGANSARPASNGRAKSAAEEALRKITQRQSTPATDLPSTAAMVQARTSSLPSPTDMSLQSPTVPASEAGMALTATAVTKQPAASMPGKQLGARPLKAVCLDCGEHEAHRRHVNHVDPPPKLATEGATGAQGPSTGEMLAAGAAAVVSGMGGLLSSPLASRSASAVPAGDPLTTLEAESSSESRPGMMRSMSMAALPTLQDGQRLMGSTPLQLIMDPIGTAAQTSGAFDVLANVSGAAIHATQDMSAIHPPLDRMAIFVHWWGFEITLPKATMNYLGTAHSVSGAFLSFLQTMAVGGGVPELLPFIKYISTFMEVEYKAILAQDAGHGVVVAATWFMPLALVPRAWDYPLDGPQDAAPPSQDPSAPEASVPPSQTKMVGNEGLLVSPPPLLPVPNA